LLAFGLVNLINDKKNKAILLEFAASGFRDFSRIAASSAEMWRDICLANKESIITDLHLYKNEVESIIAMIDQGSEEKLLAYFLKASTTRKKWNKE